jgi:cysteine desulfurase
LDMPWLEAELAKGDVGVVSAMMANNETGAVQPVAAMARLAKAHGALFHTDAVQAVGHIPVAFAALGVDAMTVSSHKLGGPKGAGALIVRPNVPMDALLTGGGQERNRRAGTEDTPAIVGFGAACAHLLEHADAEFDHLMGIRRTVLDGVRALGVEIVAEAAPKVPHILSVQIGRAHV